MIEYQSNCVKATSEERENESERERECTQCCCFSDSGGVM